MQMTMGEAEEAMQTAMREAEEALWAVALRAMVGAMGWQT